LWAGDCVAASELHAAVTAETLARSQAVMLAMVEIGLKMKK
jgi:hypothetical protein